MSWSKYLPDDRLKWTEGYNSTPIWPSEPDIAVIRQTASSVLIGEGVESSAENLPAVEFLADGARHKIYEITHPSWTTSYLFRVAVPLDPSLKMESEMATMEFIRRRTTIPVPKPVAWNSSASNPLGFEWCLLEKAPGVELREVWRTIPWEEKLRLVDRMAGIMAQLWDAANKFDEIGSVYFEDCRPQPPRKIPDTSNPPFTAAGRLSASGFCIDTSVDPAFFSGRRCYLQSERGPFKSCGAWVRALLEVEWEFIKTAKRLLLSKSDMPGAINEEQWKDIVRDEIGLDEDDLEGFDDFEQYYLSYKRLLPLVFGDQDSMASGERRFSLYHGDLRSANIIVNPSTYEITGIIDWEQTTTIPDWYALDYPTFLCGDDPFDEYDGENTPVTYDSDYENYNVVTVSARDRRDGQLLRGRFDEAMERLGRKDWNDKSALDELKLKFIEGVADLSDSWAGKRTIKQITESLDRLGHVEGVGKSEDLDTAAEQSESTQSKTSETIKDSEPSKDSNRGLISNEN